MHILPVFIFVCPNLYSLEVISRYGLFPDYSHSLSQVRSTIASLLLRLLLYDRTIIALRFNEVILIFACRCRVSGEEFDNYKT
jgi:hypothetical protein